MLETKTCISIISDMETWTGFCVVFDSHVDFAKANEIVRKAYDDWWELPDEKFEPLADWVNRCLTENKIDHDIYFKNAKKRMIDYDK